MCEKYECGKIIQFEKLNGHSHANNLIKRE